MLITFPYPFGLLTIGIWWITENSLSAPVLYKPIIFFGVIVLTLCCLMGGAWIEGKVKLFIESIE
jgi:apolipoprotein N-acyltransferase